MTPERKKFNMSAGCELNRLDDKQKALFLDVAFWRSQAMYEAERKRFWQWAWVATAGCGILSGIMSIGIILSNG